MSTYIVGDVQGCFDALMNLMNKIKFNLDKDKLIFCGDLVNRGGQTLETLRWIYAHQKQCRVVLGNHDLSLLSKYFQQGCLHTNNKEFQKTFDAPDCANLMKWLKNQKILIHDKKLSKIIVHAGIYPLWSLKRAKKEAKFVEKYIQEKPFEFFKNMYGAKPNHWKKHSKDIDRARFAVNSFTRMRFLYKNSGLNLHAKGSISDFPDLIPWFNFQSFVKKNEEIIFGHWSAIGLMTENNVTCLDTGKVWGGKLTALRINKKKSQGPKIFQV